MPVLRHAWLAPAVIVVLTTAACASGGRSSSVSAGGNAGSSGSSGSIAITAGERTCEVQNTKLQAGRHTFEVLNSAGQVTEVYVYAEGDRIVGEAENIGPGTKRALIVDLAAGDYQVACKPGMIGNGIRTALTVTAQSGAANSAGSADDRLSAAVTSYRGFVEAETQSLVRATADLTTAVARGDVVNGRALYPVARLHYERIEPIAESFGKLDPLIDMRADDVTAGQPFVGFHRIEQELFQRNNLATSKPIAEALLSNTRMLQTLVKTVEITPLTMSNGAKSLLDEVARSKVTGEEERYSRIDLVDFAANVEGSKYAYTALRPVIAERKPELAAMLDERFAALLKLLDSHRSAVGGRGYIPGSGYQSYDALSPAEVKALAVEVDSISEPLGTISAVVAGR